MQNAKLIILATICLLGLNILAGCQKSSQASVAAPETPKAAPPADAKLVRVHLHKDGSSTPPTAVLSKGDYDEIKWVNDTKYTVRVIFSGPMHSPFRSQPGALNAYTYVVPPGPDGELNSGSIRKDAHPVAADGVKEFDYPYNVEVMGPVESGALRTTKDGDVHIKR